MFVVRSVAPPEFKGASGPQSRTANRVRARLRSRKLTIVTLTEMVSSEELDDVSRKEVIQPQVPLRLPCYDFTPVTSHSLRTCPPCGLAQPFLEQLTPMV